MTLRWRTLCGLALTLLWLGCGTPLPERPAEGVALGDLDYLAQRIDWEARQALDDGTDSLTVALFDEKGVFFEKGYGRADVAAGIDAAPDTLYRVGSISKLFTAISILQLVERGRIDLDAPLVTYLPEFELKPPPHFHPGAKDWKLTDITIRSMLTHHSGIPSDVFKGFFSNEPPPYTEYVNLIRGWHAQSPVWFNSAYSNVAVTLLGHVVERVSGEPFMRYVDDHILTPSGMDASSFEATDEIENATARSYLGGEQIDPKRVGDVPAGSLFSSARELAAFGSMVLRRGQGPNGRVLRAETLESMWERQNGDVALDRDFEMGLGWFRNPLEIRGGGFSVGHGGGMLAHRSILALLPEANLGVVTLTNTAESGGAVQDLAQLALGLALEARAGVPFEETKPEPAELAQVDRARLERLSGRYSTVAGNVLLEPRGGGLRTQRIAYLSSAELRPTVRGGYQPRLRLLGWIPFGPDELARTEVRFERVGEIDAVFVELESGTNVFIGWRVAPSPVTPAWRERVGSYEIVNAGTDHLFFHTVDLRIEDDLLEVAIHVDGVPMPLTRYLEPLTDAMAVDWTPGRSGGSRVYAREVDGDTELELLGYVLRRVD